jgi:hypothetical protein
MYNAHSGIHVYHQKKQTAQTALIRHPLTGAHGEWNYIGQNGKPVA